MTDPKVTAEERLAENVIVYFVQIDDPRRSEYKTYVQALAKEALTIAAQDRPDWWASRYEDGRKSGYAEGAEAMRERAAKVAYEWDGATKDPEYDWFYSAVGIAQEIRALGFREGVEKAAKTAERLEHYNCTDEILRLLPPSAEKPCGWANSKGIHHFDPCVCIRDNTPPQCNTPSAEKE